jgi:hypothetical protein
MLLIVRGYQFAFQFFCFKVVLSSLPLLAIPIMSNVKPVVKKMIPVTGEELDEIDLLIKMIAAISIAMAADRRRSLLFFMCALIYA